MASKRVRHLDSANRLHDSGLLASGPLSAADLIAKLGQAQVNFLNIEFIICRIGSRQKFLVGIQSLRVLCEIIMHDGDEKVGCRNFPDAWPPATRIPAVPQQSVSTRRAPKLDSRALYIH